MSDVPTIDGTLDELRPIKPRDAVRDALRSLEYMHKNWLEDAFKSGPTSFEAQVVRRESAKAIALLNALVRS